MWGWGVRESGPHQHITNITPPYACACHQAQPAMERQSTHVGITLGKPGHLENKQAVILAFPPRLEKDSSIYPYTKLSAS